MMKMNVFSPTACRVVAYLLNNPEKKVSETEIAKETKLSKQWVGQIMRELVKMGAVSRPYRTSFVLSYPNQLVINWIGNRKIRGEVAYFTDNKKILKEVEHVHTLFSGAWLDVGWLTTRFTTVYVKPGFKCDLAKGKVGDIKGAIILIVPKDESVFYNARSIKGKKVVNPYQLYVDLASFGGLAQSTLEPIAEKYKLPKITD